MKTLMREVLAAKTLAAMIFAGFMCAYVVAGYLYSLVFPRAAFNFTIPFIFVLEGVVLSVVVAALWRLLISDDAPIKWRFSARLIIFALLLMAALVACVLVFFPFPTYWAKLWWIVIGCVTAGIGALAIIGEIYSRVTGKRYTEILKKYQAGL
ncbi:MAG: hypothetical protein FWF45_05995 [Coriobacteriia bacterium]|nr:hypothetical protein [Coriobacteriia bacterium]